MAILIGTGDGLFDVEGHRLVDAAIAAIDPGGALAIGNDRTLLRRDDDGWNVVAGTFDAARCVAATGSGVWIGTAEAHLAKLTGELEVEPVPSFDRVPGRETWFTPWGGPPDTRSIAETADGVLHVNVHVGGIPRSRNGGLAWEPTIDVEADVHQVLAHPTEAGLVLAAAAVGLCVSRDDGDSYDVLTDGLHSSYCRAVAIADDTVLVTACTGPHGGEAAVYRAPVALDRPFDKCERGLPEWFGDNIDTGCLAARDQRVAFGTQDGDVYVSDDVGLTWERAMQGSVPIRVVAIEP